jgi:hypothetical protein
VHRTSKHILVNLRAIGSSGARESKKYMNVDTSMWLLIVENILHSEIYCLELQCNRRDTSTVEPGFNDIGLYDTLPIDSDILW